MKILSKKVLLHKGDNGYFENRIPGIIALPNGDMCVFYECRRGGDWSVSEIGVKRSSDSGKTWSAEKYLASGNGKNTVNNPVMVFSNGILHFIYMENYKRIFCKESKDLGYTWSDEKEITYVLELFRSEYSWTVAAIGPGHGAVMVDSRIVFPIWLCKNTENIFEHRPSVIATIYSDDNLKTLKRGEIVKTPLINPNETSAASLCSGGVMINVRHESEKKKRYISFSKDGASNWYDGHFDENLSDPVCQGGMCSDDNIILFSNCNSQTERENLTLSKSTDEGQSWESLLIDHSGGYSDVCINPVTHTAFVVYESEKSEYIKIAEIDFINII